MINCTRAFGAPTQTPSRYCTKYQAQIWSVISDGRHCGWQQKSYYITDPPRLLCIGVEMERTTQRIDVLTALIRGVRQGHEVDAV